MLTPLAVLLGCPWISDADQAARLDPDADGVLWPDDCADDDDAVHPDAPEVCGDGRDNDCDGVNDGCRLSGQVALEGASGWGRDVAMSSVGQSLAAVDATGDGVTDLIAGAPWATDTSSVAMGAARVWAGPLGADLGPSAAFTEVLGLYAGGAAGWALATGDFDDDGVTELAVAAPEAALAGYSTGVVTLLDLPLPAGGLVEAEVLVGRPGYDQLFGHALAAVTTAEGDDALAVAVGSLAASSAALCLFAPAESGADASAARWCGAYGANGGGSHFLATLPDTSGDGLDELAVGDPTVTGADPYAGVVWVLDVADGTDVGQVAWSDGYSYGGYSVAGLGDVDGDGYGDLLVGSPGEGDYGGAARLFLGPLAAALTPGDAAAVVSPADGEAYVGLTVGGPGDMDEDGFAEILVAAPIDQDATGRAVLFYGPMAGNVALGDAPFTATGSAAGDTFGWTLLGPADLNDDGTGDLAVGAPGLYTTGYGAIAWFEGVKP